MNMGLLMIILCLVGIFLKMFVKCQGYLEKLTIVIDVYIFYHYIFMCVCVLKYLIKKKYIGISFSYFQAR
jgi:hypothetical protein